VSCGLVVRAWAASGGWWWSGLACVQRLRGLSLLLPSLHALVCRTDGGTSPVSMQRAKRALDADASAVQAGSAGRATPMPSCAHAPHHAQARSEFRLCARGRSWVCVESAPEDLHHPSLGTATARACISTHPSASCGLISQHRQFPRAVAAQVAPARPRIASTRVCRLHPLRTASVERWTANKRPLGRTALRGVHCSPVSSAL
jgi:hypothetical protein